MEPSGPGRKASFFDMKLLQTFNALSIRKKMMILHNIFFALLVLTFFSLINPFLEDIAGLSHTSSYTGEEATVSGLRLKLGIAVVVIYGLAVVVLEFLILPYYVYRPIRRWLLADAASQRDDRAHELIPQELIFQDEIGKIMSSRNLTVSSLRQHQRELEEALTRLEETAGDLKRKNHLLETAKQNLADQDRLVSLGMLSAGVAHELNTPLAVLQGSLEKLLENSTEPRDSDRLQRMLRVTQRIRSISESLLDFARARTQVLTAVAVRPLVNEAWSLVRLDRNARSVEFLNHTKETDEVIGNSDRLLQVFVNLLRNGVNALGEKGRLSVVSEENLRDKRSWLTLRFEDNGGGIKPEIIPKIFEPFVTSRLDARGSGLGLAVAEGIINQHGGVIIARNRKEGGACFEVTLLRPQEEDVPG